MFYGLSRPMGFGHWAAFLRGVILSGTIIRLELSLEAQQKLEAKMAELGKEEFLKQLSESVGYPVTGIERVSSDDLPAKED